MWRAPKIHIRGVVHASYGTARRATLLGDEFLANVLHGVILERNRRVTTLLGTIVYKTVLADVKVTCAGAAFPSVLAAVSDIVLKEI